MHICTSVGNIIVAGALYKDLYKSYDSNYGSKVDVFAPAHFPLKLANNNSTPWFHNESARTSASAPVIANLAIQILELNPNLTAAQVKQLYLPPDQNVTLEYKKK